jgi:hypothetical protein
MPVMAMMATPRTDDDNGAVDCSVDPEKPPVADIANHPTQASTLAKPQTDGNHWNTLFEARVVIGDFKAEHNHRHSHSVLDY